VNGLKYIKGNISWNTGLTKETDERLRKTGENIKKNAKNNPNFGNRGKHFSENHRKKIGMKHLGKCFLSKFSKEKISNANKGRKFSDEINKKKGRSGIKNPFYGRQHSKKTKKILREKIKKKWEDKEYRNKILSEDARRKRLKGLLKNPTSTEEKFINFFESHNIPLKYVGNGMHIIGFMNPDFVNLEKKICVEVRPKKMCLIWNKQSPKDYKKTKINYYSKFGWKCLVLWEGYLKNGGVLPLVADIL